jgi:hypothetical protein
MNQDFKKLRDLLAIVPPFGRFPVVAKIQPEVP